MSAHNTATSALSSYQQEQKGRIWTPAEQRLLDILQQEERSSIQVKDLRRKEGFSRYAWYKAIKNPDFMAAVEEIGVKVGYQYGMSHLQVSLTTTLEKDLEEDIWDMRRFKPDYPKHYPPATFKMDFTWIENSVLRQQMKSYFRLHLPHWKAKTFRTVLTYMKPFLLHLPSEVHVGILDRIQVEQILPHINQLGDYRACMCLRHMKSMFDFMAASSTWIASRPPRFLILDEDIPSEPRTLPRPIPPDVLEQLDTLLEQATASMKAEQQPPILNPIYWDAILILRRTGMRFEDLAHLKAPDENGRNGCLDQDSEGYWWIRLHHKISKAGKDHYIPTKISNGVIDAVHRQQARIKDVPNHFGENYLFRTQRGVLQASAFKGTGLAKIAAHLLHEGQPYVITPHQFRHTIATDMIEQGVDVYTIKEFLGHSTLHTTERYIAVYHTTLKAKYDTYRTKKQDQKILDSAMMTNQMQVSPSEDTSDGGWINSQEEQIYLSPLPNGIGNCTHPAMQEPCPNPPFCPTCPKLRVSKRHLASWENKAANLIITVEALQANPAYARARQRHEQELQHTQKVIETIKQEGFWDGHLHTS